METSNPQGTGLDAAAASFERILSGQTGEQERPPRFGEEVPVLAQHRQQTRFDLDTAGSGLAIAVGALLVGACGCFFDPIEHGIVPRAVEGGEPDQWLALHVAREALRGVDLEVAPGEPTRIGRGATIGANATILPGLELGAWSMVAAGAVVTRSVSPHELVMGNPARRAGWVFVSPGARRTGAPSLCATWQTRKAVASWNPTYS